MNPEITLFIIKLVLGGLIGFLAIMVMSKTRDLSWMCMVIGFLLSYASLVIELMVSLGLITLGNLLLFGIPLPSLICTILPSIAFILSFIFKLTRK
ncbi:MAG: hypothetical protein K5829_15360 [Treponema sp.]|nr:hypothetical protein [Treponema sp.]